MNNSCRIPIWSAVAIRRPGPDIRHLFPATHTTWSFTCRLSRTGNSNLSVRQVTGRTCSGAGRNLLVALTVDVKRTGIALDNLWSDDNLLDTIKAWKIKHRIKQNAFHD